MQIIKKKGLVLFSLFLTFYALSNMSVCIAQTEEDSYKSIAAPKLSLPYSFKSEKIPAAVHWSASLKPGEYKNKDGVIYEREPAGKRPLMIAGVSKPDQPPMKLLQDLQRINQLSPKQRVNTYNEITKWAANYYGRDLPSAKQQQLRQLYSRYSQGANKIAALKKPDSENEAQQLIENQAKLITDLLLGEREIFLNNPKAQLKRYGKVVVRSDSIKPQRNFIEKEVIHFLSGEYLKSEKSKLQKQTIVVPNNTSAEKIQYVMVPGPRLGYVYIKEILASVQTEFTPLVEVGQCKRIGSESSTEVVETPVVIGVEDRIFVSEHPVTGSTWEDMGLPNLYHTSIVVGMWFIKKTIEEVTTNTCYDLGGTPAIAKKKQAVYMKEFNMWILANGCSGTYQPYDELREVAAFYGAGAAGYDHLRQYINGTTADITGARCRARYGAYPVGYYGVNWVCHQNCNAFALIKWNMLPVFFLETSGFGFIGNLGIADIDDPCKCPQPDTHANHCCVAGNNCCWATTYGQGEGWGYFLSNGWHPEKGWIDTECQYTSESVEIGRYDEGPWIVPLNN